MKTAVLRGREHSLLGGIAAIAEGSAAVVLSRGGARKAYYCTDPNEDAAGFAEGEGGALLLVADGHYGHQAAEVAVEELLEVHAPRWTEREFPALRESWATLAVEALAGANAAILECVARGGPSTSRTTLALALVRPVDDLLAYASVADSHLFRVGARDVVDLARRSAPRDFFLGSPADTPESLAGKCTLGSESLAGTRGVVLATDGLSERGIGVEAPAAAVAEVAALAERAEAPLRALELARGVVERALEAHRRHGAGDNVASTALWL
jgi:hypothetical protein